MTKPFDQVSRLLPEPFRHACTELPLWCREQAEELRLRVGQPPVLMSRGEERCLCRETVTGRTLSDVLEAATHGSVHTALEQSRAGFFTVEGGHRIGICGSVILRDGAVWMIRELSSLNIRVARAVHGLADGLACRLPAGGTGGVLILSPPGGGKTTLLRDLIRHLSDRGERVGIADERGELAGMWHGVPQFDIGMRTDVMDGCPKAAGLVALLRGMNETVLAVDEIATEADAEAVRLCAHCGVGLLATVHASCPEELDRRCYLKPVLAPDVFPVLIVIRRGPGGVRHYEVLDRRKAL